MSKFEYILGWVATIGGIGAFVAAIVAVTALDEDAIVLVRVVWVPFIVLWGVGKIRAYRYLEHASHKDRG